jgi:hypothetical protein
MDAEVTGRGKCIDYIYKIERFSANLEARHLANTRSENLKAYLNKVQSVLLLRVFP